jgi:hypothetical protein
MTAKIRILKIKSIFIGISYRKSSLIVTCGKIRIDVEMSRINN